MNSVKFDDRLFPVEPLTRREREILTCLEKDLSNREIAETYFLAESTVKGYIQIIFQKLGVSKRREAVVRAYELGVLVPPGISVAAGSQLPYSKTQTTDFPRLSSEGARPNNLPLLLSSFIGREREIAEVSRLLQKQRMVTLTGSGGTGKTRLSLQIAMKLMDLYPKGAWLVEFAPISDPALVPNTIAQVLSLPETPNRSMVDSLVNFLRSRRLLLILDNCEHLLQACANLADKLLRTCPDLTILASSREFLGVEGEVPYRVPPMSLPDPQHLPSLPELADYDAVRLFVERAQVASPAFQLTGGNDSLVTQVVNRLDGIPLAIELAAARLRLLSLEQISQRLHDAFRLLTGGSRTALPRHQTLRALIDWSYNLLTKTERILLRRLSVFAGGWTLEGVEAVCSDPPETYRQANASRSLRTEDILDLLSGLVDKSLIQPASETEGMTWYTMLETVRQYAHEKLVDEKEAEATCDRHLAYTLRMAETLESRLRSREQVRTLNHLERELDNIRLALDWGLQRNVESELRLASALMYFWHIRFHWKEGAEWLEKGLAQLATVGDGERAKDLITVRAKALAALGVHLFTLEFNNYWQGDTSKPIALLKESVTLFRQAGPEYRRGLALALRWLAWATDDRKTAQEALTICREINDAFGIVESIMILADNATDFQIMIEALAIAKTIGDEDAIAYILEASGHQALFIGDLEKARGYFLESQEHYRQVGNSTSVMRQLRHLAYLYFFLGDYQQADRCLDEAGVGFREIGQDTMVLECLEVKAHLYLSQGLFAQVFQCIEAIETISSRGKHQYHDAKILYFQAVISRHQGNLSLAGLYTQNFFDSSRELDYMELVIIALYEQGKLAIEDGAVDRARGCFLEGMQPASGYSFTFGRAFPYAGLAGLSAKLGEFENAARLFGAGNQAFHGGVNTLPLNDRLEYLADMEKVRSALGEGRFDELYQEGSLMTREQVVVLVMEGNG